MKADAETRWVQIKAIYVWRPISRVQFICIIYIYIQVRDEKHIVLLFFVVLYIYMYIANFFEKQPKDILQSFEWKGVKMQKKSQ